MSGSIPQNLLSPLGSGTQIPGGEPSVMPGPQSLSMSPKAGSVQDAMDQHYTRSKTAFQNSQKALRQLDHIRKSLERLSDKQDLVTMEDIVTEASKLTSHGIDPVALAGMLADAPQEGGGEALGGWVATHAQTAMAAEQQLIQQHDLNRHQMGVAALTGIMAHIAGHGFPSESPSLDQTQESPNENPLQTQDPVEGGLGISPDATSNPLAYGARFMTKYDKSTGAK